MENVIPWCGKSDIGRQRKSNQDCFAAFPEVGIWVLADGMGGHVAGAEAAVRAVAVVAAEVRAGKSLPLAVECAHLEVIRLGEELLRDDKTGRHPGCTVVALRLYSVAGVTDSAVVPDSENVVVADFDAEAEVVTYEIVWVGDSRAWLWDGRKLSRLTTDHSIVQDLVNWGDLTEEEALEHPQRHQLSQALGVGGRDHKLRPGCLSGTFNPQTEMIILTSDGAFCHDQLPDTAVKLLQDSSEPEEIVSKMIGESLGLGGEDNVTVVAVGRIAADCRSAAGPETSITDISDTTIRPGFFGKLRQRWRQTFLLFFLAFLLLNLIPASLVHAEMPRGDQLDSVCQEVAARLAANYGSHPLERVAVYFIYPRGCRSQVLNPQELREAKVIALALQDALTARTEFKVLNRDNERWARVLHEEGNRGTLDGNDIMRVGTGLGAHWIVTGEYWQTSDGRFRLNARLFNGITGEGAAIAHVDSSFVSSRRHHWRPLLLGVAAFLLLLFGGWVLLLATKKRNVRVQKQEDARVVSVGQDNLAQAIARRDPGFCDHLRLNPDLTATLPHDLQKLASAMQAEVEALKINDFRDRLYVIAPGPEQGLGRGDKWLFSFSDPRISRAPQAHLKLDGGRFFVVHNHEVANPTLVNGESITVHALEIGNEISLSSQTLLQMKSLLSTGGALLEIIAGPDAGRSLVIFKRELKLAEIFSDNGAGAGRLGIPEISIIREKGRYQLALVHQTTCTENVTSAEITIRNPEFATVDIELKPGSRIVLCDGDQLYDGSGHLCFSVKL